MHRRYRHRPGTFWLPLEGTAPRCGLEDFALAVLRFHLQHGGPAATQPHAQPPPSGGDGAAAICGAEWWVQVRRVGTATEAAGHEARPGARRRLGSDGAAVASAASATSIAFHWDSDEARMRGGVHVPPLLATVTYLGGAGAPTLVLPLAADAKGIAQPPRT